MSELFMMFLATSLANILAPELGTVVAVTTSLQYGWRRSVWSCMGLACGIGILFSIALSGIGIIIASSPKLFTAIKLAGAIYLIYLGIKTIRKDAGRTAGLLKHAGSDHEDTIWKHFSKSILISLTNPQAIVFCLSVFPQFIDPEISYVPQVSFMIFVYVLMVWAVMQMYAVLAGQARRFLSGPQGPRLVNVASGVVFILIALYVLARTFLL